jgi:5-carboxymethyl-2-hydroxymuconate isomerase
MSRGERAMTHADDQEPKGWRELCAKLQVERDPERFRELADEINRLLSAHEKANRQDGNV